MLKSSQTIEEVIATLPSGEKITLKPNKSFLPFYQTHEAGIYHISAKDSGGVLRNYTFAANLLNDDEADLSITQTEIPVSQKAAVSGAVKPDNKIPMEFWRYLLIACVFFLLGEWWLYFKESE